MIILSIGGSDPSSGAGIQGDLRTFTELGIHGCTVITAITSQNTSSFNAVQPVSSKHILAQIDSILSDFKISAIIISMVYNNDIINAIYSKLKKSNIPIIVDPVIYSTTGGTLLLKNSLSEYRKKIIPLARIITPNVKEAEIISGKKIFDQDSLYDASKIIQSHGPETVVITGIDNKTSISDFILIKNKKYMMTNKKIQKINHGGGCVFSSSLAVAIAKGNSTIESIRFARETTLRAIKNSKQIGKGIEITDLSADEIKSELSEGITKFTHIKNIHNLIPECQTNFTYSKENPKKISDIAGIVGRIVKTGNRVTVAGEIEYGGSKHVASALFEINKKFPEIRSAINIKFTPEILRMFQKNRLKISNYDRAMEPKNIKNIENSSISWGIKQAIKRDLTPPDIIYHKGDHGKEPMILVFGKSPKDVLKKIEKCQKNLET